MSYIIFLYPGFRSPLRFSESVLEFLNNICGLGTEYRNRVAVTSRQATQPGGIGSVESILGLLKSLNIRAQYLQNRVSCMLAYGAENHSVGISLVPNTTISLSYLLCPPPLCLSWEWIQTDSIYSRSLTFQSGEKDGGDTWWPEAEFMNVQYR
jgi:hypothetical protein